MRDEFAATFGYAQGTPPSVALAFLDEWVEKKGQKPRSVLADEEMHPRLHTVNRWLEDQVYAVRFEMNRLLCLLQDKVPEMSDGNNFGVDVISNITGRLLSEISDLETVLTTSERIHQARDLCMPIFEIHPRKFVKRDFHGKLISESTSSVDVPNPAHTLSRRLALRDLDRSRMLAWEISVSNTQRKIQLYVRDVTKNRKLIESPRGGGAGSSMHS